METTSRFITPGLVFLLTLVFGIWLSRSGKPYNGILFNVHKLIALGAVIVTALQLYSTPEITVTQTTIILLLVLTGACVVASFVSGALMSVGNRAYDTLRALDRLAPIVMVIAMAAAVYLLATGQPV